MEEAQIFKGEGDRQLKFFLQKDIDEKIAKDLTAQITAHGGRIENKVPIQGYVLIQPKSREAARLISCWSTADRPLRHFVPFTFVWACVRENKVLPQVFRKADEPIRIHLHPSITNERMFETLEGRIWNSGGDPTVPEEYADVIIANQGTPIFRKLVERYEHSRDKYVEPIIWVKQCVDSGVYENTPVVKKNLGGRPAGHTRTEFTEADDNHLASYIACRLPDPSMRGRTGNKLYQDLCSRLDLYPWSDRHPWQSWRERYKNHVPRFSRLVAAFVEKQPAHSDGKGLHGFVRAPVPSSSKNRIDDEPAADPPTEEHAEWGSQWEVRVGRKSPPAWARGKRKAEEAQGGSESPSKKVKPLSHPSSVLRPGEIATAEQLQEWKLIAGGRDPGIQPPWAALESSQAAPPPDNYSERSITRSRSPETVGNVPPAAEAVDYDSEDEVAVGSETQVFLDAHKDMLAGLSSSRPPTKSPESLEAIRERHNRMDPAELPPECRKLLGLPESRPLPNHDLVHIACEHRFMLDEVLEVYEELGKDLGATKQHFKEVRDYITAKRKALAK